MRKTLVSILIFAFTFFPYGGFLVTDVLAQEVGASEVVGKQEVLETETQETEEQEKAESEDLGGFDVVSDQEESISDADDTEEVVITEQQETSGEISESEVEQSELMGERETSTLFIQDEVVSTEGVASQEELNAEVISSQAEEERLVMEDIELENIEITEEIPLPVSEGTLSSDEQEASADVEIQEEQVATEKDEETTEDQTDTDIIQEETEKKGFFTKTIEKATEVITGEVRIHAASELVEYAEKGDITPMIGEEGSVYGATFERDFTFEENEKGSKAILLEGLSVETAGGEDFDVAELGIKVTLDHTVGALKDKTSLEFGIPGQHLIFSDPVHITVPTELADGTIVNVQVEHAGSGIGTEGITMNAGATCAEGISSDENNQAVVADAVIMFYTCGASTFILDPDGDTFSETTLWLKADAGVTASGGAVSAWADQSNYGRDMTQSDVNHQPVYNTTTGTNLLNFNPTLTFEDTPSSTADVLFRTNTRADDFISKEAGSAFGVGVHYRSVSNNAYLNQYSGFDHAVHFAHSSPTGPVLNHGFIALGDGGLPEDFVPVIESGINANGTRTIYRQGEELGSQAISGVVPVDVLRPAVVGGWGAPSQTAFGTYSGEMAEVITYDEALDTTSQKQVESYLALKYGITLDETGPISGQYLASEETAVWSSAGPLGDWSGLMTTGGDDSWQAVAYGNGTYVAVGDINSPSPDLVMTSPDGVTWTSRSAVGDNEGWRGITYGNGLFVAVSAQGSDRVMTSPDGIAWTARPIPISGFDDGWQDIIYVNGMFVAVAAAGDNSVMTSPDGITWTYRPAAGDDDGLAAIAYGNGMFVAVGGSGDRILTSPNGITWTPQSAVGDDDSWRGVAYGNGLFVAVAFATDGESVITSPDGIIWTERTTPASSARMQSVAFGEGRFVAVGSNSAPTMSSTDGITWTAMANPSGSTFWRDVVYLNGEFISVGGLGSNYLNVMTNDTTSLGYHNDVFGLGQDDASTLNQRVSKSVNADAIVTIASDSDFTNANGGTRTAMGDGNFIVMGNNDGAAVWTAAGAPEGYQILERQWKVDETGIVGSANIQFDVADIDFDIPTLISGTDYYIVVDTNDDQSLVDEDPTVLVTTSADLWSAAIDFADGAVFTVATELPNLNTFSGTVYVDKGVTPIAAGKAVQLLVNGTVVANTTTDASGDYSMQASVVPGDIVTVFIDDETENGTLVDKVRINHFTGGAASMFDLDIYQDRININGAEPDFGYDDTFGATGFITTSPFSRFRTAEVLPDGKILVAGSFKDYGGIVGLNNIARLHPDGTIDTEFLPVETGTVSASTSQKISAVEPLSSGKILIGGAFTEPTNYLARLEADGSHDTGFSAAPFASGSRVSSITEQPDGKILVGGFFTNYVEVGRNYLVRLLEDGTLDTTFNPLTFNDSLSDDSIRIVDGNKILVGGSFEDFNGEDRRDGLVRLHMSDGSLDTDFNLDAGGLWPRDIQVLSNGKILIPGIFEDYNNVDALDYFVRLNPNGSTDTDYIPTAVLNGSPQTVLVGENESTYTLGGGFTGTQDGNSTGRIVRFNSDGTLNTDFTDTDGFTNFPFKILAGADGSMIVAGWFNNYKGEAERDSIVKFNYTYGTSITNADLDLANNGDGDITALYDDGGATTYTTPDTAETCVSGHYVPMGNIDAGTVDNRGLFELESNDATVAGDWTNAGTFSATGTSLVTLDGGDQVMTGDTTFVGLQKSSSTSPTLTIASGTVISGETLTLTGGGVGRELLLRTTPDDGTNTADMSFTSVTGSFLDIKDINAPNQVGSEVDPASSIDSGNNVGWFVADSIAPQAPTVDPVSTTDTEVTGIAEPGSTVTVTGVTCTNAPVIADAAGNYTCTMPGTVPSGTIISVTATDDEGNTSTPTTTTVYDETTETNAPTVNAVDDDDLRITGTAEIGATIDLSGSSPSITCTNAPVTADAAGNWVCELASTLSSGDVVSVVATAPGENPSPAVTTTVTVAVDTVPNAPIVDPTDGTPITGSCSLPDAEVEVINVSTGNTAVCSTTADGAGDYSCSPVTPVATDSDILHVTCSDGISISNPTPVIVDTIAPEAPGLPDLKASSDTGISDEDEITSDDEPVFIIQCTVVGEHIWLYANSVSASNSIGDALCTSLGDLEIPVGPLPVGDYNIIATARDAAGNESVGSVALPVKIDTAGPISTPPPTSPTAPSVVDNGTLLTGSCGAPAANGILRVTTTLPGALNPDPTDIPLDENGDYSTVLNWNASATGNTYSLDVMCIDAAGNPGPITNVFPITVDLSGPGVEITHPGQDDPTNVTTVTFTVVFSEPILPGTFDVDDIDTSASTGVTPGTITINDSGDATTFTIVIETAGDGDLVISIPAGGIQDSGGNSNTISVDTDNVVTIDTQVPSAPANRPDLTDATDSGHSQDDYITNIEAPDFTVECPAADYIITLYANGDANGTHLCLDAGPEIATIATDLPEGENTVTYTVTDLAGNESLESPGLGVTIDTIDPPSQGDTPDLHVDSDTGFDDADDLTSINTPEINVECTEALAIVRLYQGTPPNGVEIGKHDCASVGTEILTVDPALPDGTYEFYSTIEDRAGNLREPTNTLEVTILNAGLPPISDTIDLVDASDTGDEFTDNETGDNTPTFEVECRTDKNRITLYIDGAISATYECQGVGFQEVTVDNPIEPDGSYTAEYTEMDIYGNETPRSPGISITIDTTPPPTPVVAPDLDAGSDTGVSQIDDITSNTTPEILVDCTQAGATALLYTDNPDPDNLTLIAEHPCIGIGQELATVTVALEEGDHNVTTVMVDEFDNASEPSPRLSVIVIDTIAPDAPIFLELQADSDTGSSQTDGNTQDTTPTFDVSCTAKDHVITFYDGTGAVIGSHECQGIGQEAAEIGPLAEGTYDVTITDTDPAGNESAQSDPAFDLVIDLTDPDAPGLPDLTDASDTGVDFEDEVTQVNILTFTVTCVTAGDQMVLYDDQVSPGNILGSEECIGPGPLEIIVGPLDDRVHEIILVATDLAGNESVESPHLAVTVNTQPPQTPSQPNLQDASDTGISPTDNNTSDDTPTFDVTCTDIDNVITFYDGVGASIGSYTCSGPGEQSAEIGPLIDGVYDVVVTETDTLGNESERSPSLEVTIDQTAPGTSGGSAPTELNLQEDSDTGTSYTDGITSDTTPTFDITCFELRSTITFYNGTGNAIGTHLCEELGDQGATIGPLPEGDYLVTTIEEDLAGNQGEPSAPLPITIDLTAPNTPGIVDLQAGSDTGDSDTDNITEDTTPTVDVTCTEEGSTLTLYSDNPTPGTVIGTHLCVGTEVASITLGLAAGTHNVTVTETDKAGNESNQSPPLTITIGSEEQTVPIYRFWSDAYQSHFYTKSLQEKISIEELYPSFIWRYEGVAFRAFAQPGPERVAVYRFWSAQRSQHFYTVDGSEQLVTSADPEWESEGIAWYLYQAKTIDSKALYRFYSANYSSHFYTSSRVERDSVIATDPNWAYEGITAYVPL